MAEVLHYPGIWLSHSFFTFFCKKVYCNTSEVIRNFIHQQHPSRFKIPLNFWPNKGILSNDLYQYIPETPTLESMWSFKFLPSAFSVHWNFKFISCCSWVRDFPAAEYPAAGWTEFTPFAYQPRKKLSRRVWEEAIEGPTGQVVDFWLVMFWLVMFYSSMWSGYTTPLWFRSTFCCIYIMAAWTQDISEIQTELEFEISQIDENHCSQMKIWPLWPWSPRKKIRGRTSHEIILAGDAYV